MLEIKKYNSITTEYQLSKKLLESLELSELLEQKNREILFIKDICKRVEKSKTVGKYVWRTRYENPVTCKAEKTSITLTSKSKQAGNQALNLMLDKIKKKIEKQSATLDIASEFILFSDIIDIWLEDQVRKIKHSTYATRTRYCNILKKDFKGKAIGDFSPLMIQRYFNKMPYTRKTLVTYFGIFRQIMNFAFRLDFIKVDLMKKVEKDFIEGAKNM